MVDDQRLLLAILLSVGILVGFHYFVEKPRLETLRAQQALQQAATLAKQQANPAALATVQTLRPRPDVIAETKRIPLENGSLKGSINLKGARLDDLTLTAYRETLDKNSPSITLLSPSGSAAPTESYFSALGWLSDNKNLALPTLESEWQASGSSLTPTTPITLTWSNGQGLQFVRQITLDERYMFQIVDRVKNTGATAVKLYPFALLARQGVPVDHGHVIAHTGPLAVVDGTLKEFGFKQVADEKNLATEGKTSWVGVADKYWLMAFIPSKDGDHAASGVTTVRFEAVDQQTSMHGLYQTDWRGTAITLNAGEETSYTTHMFAGAKEVHTLDGYGHALSILNFDRAIDFGWFYFITKPLLLLLDWLAKLLGNTGVAILAMTVIVKIAVLPLGVKSFKSMARLKQLQPEMTRLMERFKEDKMAQSQAMMDLYKREKVSPFSGCMPILLQIPIFFALYKVLYVGIEMRHAPFFGWIKDLSAPDPTSLFNLFGLIPWEPPGFLMIGVFPLLMGVTMWLQQKLSPQPPDKTQAQVLMIMPFMFTFMLASMASGLVIYWTWSNLISIAQQFLIYRRMGVKT